MFTIRTELVKGGAGDPVNKRVVTGAFALTVSGLQYVLSKNNVLLTWNPPTQVDPATGIKVCSHAFIFLFHTFLKVHTLATC